MKFTTRIIAGLTLMVLFAFALTISVPAQAEEQTYPAACYTEDELKKVREWEKTWVGKRIDVSNVDGVKEFLPQPLYGMIKDPEKWGPAWFDIVPYRTVMPTKGDIKYTNEFMGTPKTGKNDGLHNYKSGIPFPFPKTALEVMYNKDKINLGDTLHANARAWVIDGRRKYDRKLHLVNHGLWFTGRREVPPTPNLHNPKGIYRAMHNLYREPASMRGTRSMSVKWENPTKPYGSWSFSSSTRRVKRRSTASRMDHVGGSDMCYDDNLGYDYQISAQKYKLIGRKELLVPRHQDPKKLYDVHREGYCFPNGGQLERVKTWVIEAKHNNPAYLYTNQIYYICPETWYINYAEKFDRKGKLWKLIMMFGTIVPSEYNAEMTYVSCQQHTIDIQRIHATGGPVQPTIGLSDKYHVPSFYNPKALQEYGY